MTFFVLNECVLMLENRKYKVMGEEKRQKGNSRDLANRNYHVGSLKMAAEMHIVQAGPTSLYIMPCALNHYASELAIKPFE